MTPTLTAEVVEFKPKEWPSETFQEQVGCGHLYVHIIYSDDEKAKVRQVICHTSGGRHNDCGDSHVASTADLVTALLRRLEPSEYRLAVKALANHHCNRETFGKTSCSNAVAKVLRRVLKND